MNPRTCIVTRDAKDAGELIRFVCDPADNVVPDLKGDLPGRGVWVSAKQAMVVEAMKRNLFAKGLEKKVTVSDTLDTDIAELMHRSVMGALAMANKAGVIVYGYSKVNDLIRSGSAKLVMHAEDAAADGIRKIGSALRAIENSDEDDETDGDKAPFVVSFSSSDDLEKVLGGVNIMHVAAKPGGATKDLKKKLIRLQNYCSE